MKKVVELEGRWKAYKYKRAIFYLFVALLVAFIALLTFFIKMQVFDKKYRIAQNPQNLVKSVDSAPKIPLDSAKVIDSATDSANFAESNKVAESTKNIAESTTDSALTQDKDKIEFICRQVIVDKLTARQNASVKSTPLGYYPMDAIFCASESNSSWAKTQNGWVNISDKYSQIVDVNMFVDTGFYKYQNIATPAKRQIPKTSVEEVRVFDKPINSAESTPQIAPKIAESKPKKPLLITSQSITKEQTIEFKKVDFRNNKDYKTAIEVARYYYEIKDYENSIKWALNASNADSRGKQKSESWIIYAKSLYLSGKKEQAISVLDRYTSSTNAKDALDVLNKMRQGII
ncbi:tetratricopeptide repeat protein [Helicobacter sp. 23-1045]